MHSAQVSHLSLALASGDRLAPLHPAPSSMQSVASLLASLSPAEILRRRTSAVERVEALASSLRPANAALLASLDPGVSGVLQNASPSGVHLVLLRELLAELEWPDAELFKDLCEGFPLSGEIPADPSAADRVVRKPSVTASELLEKSVSLNEALLQRHLRSLHRTDLSDLSKVSATTVADIALQRCSPWETPDPSGPHLFSRRFPVRQASSAGVVKVSCIDDLAESQVNSTTSVLKKIRMDRVADLVSIIRFLQSRSMVLCKSDFAAAYRSVPIRPSEYPLASFLFFLEGPPGVFSARMSTQHAMPFGAVGAVYSWDRLGAAASALIRSFLIIPLGRYVDDLFWIDDLEIALDSQKLVLRFVAAL